MLSKKNLLLFLTFFLLYQAWGAFWILRDIFMPDKTFLASGFMLNYLGLPSTLLFSGGRNIFNLILLSVFGGLQWGLLASIVTTKITSKKKQANTIT